MDVIQKRLSPPTCRPWAAEKGLHGTLVATKVTAAGLELVVH